MHCLRTYRCVVSRCTREYCVVKRIGDFRLGLCMQVLSVIVTGSTLVSARRSWTALHGNGSITVAVVSHEIGMQTPGFLGPGYERCVQVIREPRNELTIVAHESYQSTSTQS